jgi:hypothetical protein
MRLRAANTAWPLPAVPHGVTARSTAQHRAEVVDEVCLVVPAEADSEVGEVDARVALDLQCGLLWAVATSSSRWIGPPNNSLSTGWTRPRQGSGVAAEPRGEPAGPESRSDNPAALTDRRVKHPLHDAVTNVFGSGKPWRGLSSPHSWVMCSDGNVMTVLSNGPCSRRSQLTDQKCSTNGAAASDGPHRSRSNTDVLAARPTTPRMGAACVAFF